MFFFPCILRHLGSLWPVVKFLRVFPSEHAQVCESCIWKPGIHWEKKNGMSKSYCTDFRMKQRTYRTQENPKHGSYLRASLVAPGRSSQVRDQSLSSPSSCLPTLSTLCLGRPLHWYRLA